MISNIIKLAVLSLLVKGTSIVKGVERRATTTVYTHTTSWVPYSGNLKKKRIVKRATTEMYYNSYCGGYSHPAIYKAPNIDLNNNAWQTDVDFLNLFKECNTRGAGCIGVNFKDPSAGDGFSLRVNNPTILVPGATWEWCATLTSYEEFEERICIWDSTRQQYYRSWVTC